MKILSWCPLLLPTLHPFLSHQYSKILSLLNDILRLIWAHSNRLPPHQFLKTVCLKITCDLQFAKFHGQFLLHLSADHSLLLDRSLLLVIILPSWLLLPFKASKFRNASEFNPWDFSLFYPESFPEWFHRISWFRIRIYCRCFLIDISNLLLPSPSPTWMSASDFLCNTSILMLSRPFKLSLFKKSYSPL